MSNRESTERMTSDLHRENELLREALEDVHALFNQMDWSQGQEGDGYTRSETVYRTTLSSAKMTRWHQMKRQVGLALQGKSLADAACEEAQARLMAAQKRVQEAQAELDRLKAEAGA